MDAQQDLFLHLSATSGQRLIFFVNQRNPDVLAQMRLYCMDGRVCV